MRLSGHKINQGNSISVQPLEFSKFAKSTYGVRVKREQGHERRGHMKGGVRS
jgi:hypothetical protein